MIEKAHDLPPADDGDGAQARPPEPAAGAGAPATPLTSAGGRSRGRPDRGRAADRGALEPLASAAGDRNAAGMSPEGELPGGDGLDAAADAAASAGLPLGARIEALLFASAQPLSPVRLANVLDVDVAAVHAALEGLAAAWAARPGAVDLVEIAGGFRFLTRPEFHADVGNLRGKAGTERLSPAALETLAVVAYRQPIGRAEVEAVRGVQVGPVLRLLLDRDLIRVTGRSTEPGHPLLYGTTRRFLDHFGLKSLKALPDLKDLLESP
jgi:segregation and condensation protein B